MIPIRNTRAGTASIQNIQRQVGAPNQKTALAPPANLADLRGLELHLDGISENIAPGQISNESAPFTTAVYFKNRTN